MKTIRARIPESLVNQAVSLAKREKMTIDELIAVALASQVSAWSTRDYLIERGKQAKLEDLGRVLDKVRKVPPEKRDRI